MKNSISILDTVSNSSSPTQRGLNLSQTVKKVGFDWGNISGIKDKLKEELVELDRSLADNDVSNIKPEIGDVFFCLINLCIYLNIDPDDCLTMTNDKFEKRFKYVESRVMDNDGGWDLFSREELDIFWCESKKLYK